MFLQMISLYNNFVFSLTVFDEVIAEMRCVPQKYFSGPDLPATEEKKMVRTLFKVTIIRSNEHP